jgi:hypothetical protein
VQPALASGVADYSLGDRNSSACSARNVRTLPLRSTGAMIGGGCLP